MASSEGQTELLTGWSCVVHQPSEDPEPSELPSTVDITAFSAGLNVEPATNTPAGDCSDSDSDTDSGSNNSGSDGSGSCSQSDSSDTDSSTSSSTSRSPSPEFSVTSQPNGLRLTIATVRKSCGSPVVEKVAKSETVKPPDKALPKVPENKLPAKVPENKAPAKVPDSKAPAKVPDKTPAKVPDKAPAKVSDNKAPVKVADSKGPPKVCNLSSSSDSDSDSNHAGNSDDSKSSVCAGKDKKVPVKMRAKQAEKGKGSSAKKDAGVSPKNAAKGKVKAKRKKMASLPLSRSSTSSSSDSDESDADSAMLASCSLQEIRQEDLAAILPDQQECDAFGAFEEAERNSPQTGDASGSDMELPQQAVNALIQRTTESSSESESHPPPNPGSLYANSLLQQFVAQTQMLNTQLSQPDAGGSSQNDEPKTSDMEVKRKRGRPKKVNKNSEKPVLSVEYCGDPNVSPDSGIQNSPDHVSSPDCSPLPVTKTKYLDTKKLEKSKQLDKKSSSKHSTNKTKEQPKLTVTSNRFDRILYGNTDRVLYPPRRKAGRPPIVQKKGPGRPPKHKSTSDSTKMNVENKTKKQQNVVNGSKEVKPVKTTHLTEICEKVSKRLELNEKSSEPGQSKDETVNIQKNKDKIKSGTKLSNNRIVLGNKNKIDKVKNKYLTLKNAKLMHSKHKHKKHKKCKFKILKPATAAHIDPKLNAEIEKLILDFMKLCNISTNKPAKENVPEMLKVLKKVSKKRKTSDYSERKKKKQNTTSSVNKETNNEQRLPLKKRHYHITPNNEAVSNTLQVEPSDETKNKTKTVITTTDKDKKLDVTKSPSVNIKQSSVIKSNSASPKVSGINNNEYEPKNTGAVHTHIEEAIEACITKYATVKPEIKVEEKPQKCTITTPKKRHRLEQTNITPEKVITDVKIEDTKTNIETAICDTKKRNLATKLDIKKVETIAQVNTRKKNRLEDLTSNLVSKINSTEEVLCNKRKVKNEDRATVIKYPACKKAKPIESEQLEKAVDEKPTGIFMPTVDLEIHIPTKIAIKEEKMKESPKITTDETVAPIKTEVKRKVRKRRAINRTGFPTIKKKKKKIAPVEPTIPDIKPVPCDRVPKDGEEYSSFVERTEKVCETTDLYNVTKWEVLSECDSLPQDERIDFESLEVKQERMSLRNRDSSPALSLRESTPDNRSSDLEELPLDERLKRLKKLSKHTRKREVLERKCNEHNLKKRLRDVSPASSIEPFTEKRLREERASASGDDCRKNKKAPRWRKKYLVAGLFSDYYKEDDEKAKQRRNDLVASKTKLVYNPDEHPYGLFPAPYHCGKYLRCRRIPFQLPHDLWWQHTHSQLPGRDLVPSWNYRKIRTNVYNVKNTTGACEPQTCNCKSSSECGDDCINRLVLAECPASHKCHNQRIQKHEWAPGIEKFMTEHKGWGVKTNLQIKSSEFILEYVGEVVSDQEFKERMATRYVHDTHHYCLHLDGGLVIDGHRMGGDGRFVNHSCQPNCEMQKWSVNGQFRMALFALREIKPGEELTYDYNFSLFNPAEGQECKCGTDDCRGVIGGKSQRIRPPNPPTVTTQPGRVGRPRKNQAKKAPNGPKEVTLPPQQSAAVIAPQMKPMSHAQRQFVLQHHCFLLRNLKKVKRVKTRSVSIVPVAARTQTATPTNQTANTTFLNQLNALRQPRNIKTRRVAQVEENPELSKAVRLANVLRDIFNTVLGAKDEHGDKFSVPFMQCPPKRRVPEYYQKIVEPIDLTAIEQSIETGNYKNVESFDTDMNKLFSNVIKFYGRTSDLGIASARLRKIYNEAKKESLPKFENVLGIKPPAKFIPNKKKGEEEDIIRCICGMFRDEGLMIQCERCLVWQHCECVRADENAPSYHCENCVPRKVDYEISMDEYTEHGHQYYMTLLRGQLQLRQGDTVYVLRDIPIPGSDKKHTYDTIGEIKYGDLDIFRIERLWKDSKTGQRLAYGHHYLRPHETYHEPTRRFFPNEVMRVPLYEAVPVELVISHCWVMDLNTFCKGRPIGAPEEHIYICEYRVDKGARLFSKVSKSKFPMCTKTYAFERFDVRLKISRTYTPHDLDPAFTKQRGRKPQEADDVKNETAVAVPVHVPVARTRVEQKTRLNTILLKLLGKMSTKHTLDVSYLLEGGRRRKKQT